MSPEEEKVGSPPAVVFTGPTGPMPSCTMTGPTGPTGPMPSCAMTGPTGPTGPMDICRVNLYNRNVIVIGHNAESLKLAEPTAGNCYPLEEVRAEIEKYLADGWECAGYAKLEVVLYTKTLT